MRVLVLAQEEGVEAGLLHYVAEEFVPIADEHDPQQQIIAMLAMLGRMIGEADSSIEVQGRALLRKSTQEDRAYTRRKAVTHRERR